MNGSYPKVRGHRLVKIIVSSLLNTYLKLSEIVQNVQTGFSYQIVPENVPKTVYEIVHKIL